MNPNDPITEEILKIIRTQEKNDGDITCIFRNEDGNFTGYMKKHGELISVREGTPETVLGLLLTHS